MKRTKMMTCAAIALSAAVAWSGTWAYTWSVSRGAVTDTSGDTPASSNTTAVTGGGGEYADGKYDIDDYGNDKGDYFSLSSAKTKVDGGYTGLYVENKVFLWAEDGETESMLWNSGRQRTSTLATIVTDDDDDCVLKLPPSAPFTAASDVKMNWNLLSSPDARARSALITMRAKMGTGRVIKMVVDVDDDSITQNSKTVTTNLGFSTTQGSGVSVGTAGGKVDSGKINLELGNNIGTDTTVTRSSKWNESTAIHEQDNMEITDSATISVSLPGSVARQEEVSIDGSLSLGATNFNGDKVFTMEGYFSVWENTEYTGTDGSHKDLIEYPDPNNPPTTGGGDGDTPSTGGDGEGPETGGEDPEPQPEPDPTPDPQNDPEHPEDPENPEQGPVTPSSPGADYDVD